MSSTNYSRQRGFTFVELVMVVVILGVLSIAVVPRMFDADAFRRKGFEGEFAAALRYAQKSAIAANCAVTFTTTAVQYSAAFTGSCTPAPVNLPSLTGSASLVQPVPDGMTLSAGAVTFDGAGMRSGGAGSFTLTAGSETTNINISATGYIQ